MMLSKSTTADAAHMPSSCITLSLLQLLLCGTPHLDFYALENKSRYEAGYAMTCLTAAAIAMC